MNLIYCPYINVDALAAASLFQHYINKTTGKELALIFTDKDKLLEYVRSNSLSIDNVAIVSLLLTEDMYTEYDYSQFFPNTITITADIQGNFVKEVMNQQWWNEFKSKYQLPAFLKYVTEYYTMPIYERIEKQEYIMLMACASSTLNRDSDKELTLRRWQLLLKLNEQGLMSKISQLGAELCGLLNIFAENSLEVIFNDKFGTETYLSIPDMGWLSEFIAHYVVVTKGERARPIAITGLDSGIAYERVIIPIGCGQLDALENSKYDENGFISLAYPYSST